MRRREQGFTIIEVMVAALVILAALGVVVTTAYKIRGLSTTGETKAAATKVAQQELDRLRSLGWERLQMDAAPTVSATSDAKNPVSSYYLTTTTYRPSTDSTYQPLVVGTAPDPGDTDLRDVSSTRSAWTSGQSEGYLYRFVTYGDDTSCGTNCPSSYDYKRITVAVTVTKPVGAIANPVIVSTQVSNPVDAPVSTVTNSSGTTPAVFQGLTYYLYDNFAYLGTRVGPSADHNRVDTHDKPNFMDQDPPPDPNPDPANPTITVNTYKYSKDMGGTTTFGRGIQTDSNCDKYDNDHLIFWVSPQLTSPVKLTGNGAADIYTQTLDGLTHPGRICIGVYDVPSPLASDGKVSGTETLIGTVQSYQLNPWVTSYDEQQFSFRFLATSATYYTVASGRRIGIKITAADKLADNVTATGDLTIMYDHPDYPTSIGLETQQ